MMKIAFKKLLLIGAAFVLLPHFIMLSVALALGRIVPSWMLPMVIVCIVSDLVGIAFFAWAGMVFRSLRAKGNSD